MVKYHNGLTHVEQILTFCITGLISIHYYHNCIIVYNISGLVTVDKHIFIIIRIVLESLDDRSYRHGRIIHYNVSFLIQGFGRPVNTDAGTDRIHIRDLMPHNHNLIFAHHKLSESMGFYTGFYTGTLAHLLGLPAKVGHLVTVFDHYLVAAPAKSQVNGNTGILIILGIAWGIDTDTNTDGHCHIVTDINRLYILQDIEPFFLQFLQRTLAHDKNKFIFLQLLDQTVYLTEILIQLSLYQSHQKRPSYFFYAVQGLLIVVQIQQSRYQLLIFFLTDIPVQFRLVKKIQCGQIVMPLCLYQAGFLQKTLNRYGTHDRPIVFFSILKSRLCLILSGQFVFGQLREKIGHRLPVSPVLP